MKKGTPVIVDWIDTCSNSQSWVERNDSKMLPIKSRSIGFLLDNTPKYVALYAMDNDQGDVTNRTTIPKGCIKKIRRLK